MKIIAQYMHGGQVVKQLSISRRTANKICKHTGATLTKSNTESNPLVITWGNQIQMFIEEKKSKRKNTRRLF